MNSNTYVMINYFDVEKSKYLLKVSQCEVGVNAFPDAKMIHIRYFRHNREGVMIFVIIMVLLSRGHGITHFTLAYF